jgi:prepilin-type N-terminal cleavage/methylation domain-containing protein
MCDALIAKRGRQAGFSLLEMMLATVILLVGLVAVAQLVPASILLNDRNRWDSSALVFAQREMDQFVDQSLSTSTFTDALGNTCDLGLVSSPGTVQGNPLVVINNQTVINFGAAPQPGYSFDYTDPADPNRTSYDVRWAVILTATGPNVSSKRIILGIRPSGDTYFPPVNLDTMVEK